MKQRKRQIKVHNKSDKPDNIVIKENATIQKCESIERELPLFLRDFYIYLKGSVSINTRLAYLRDIKFYFEYLILDDMYDTAESVRDISLATLNKVRARDVNYYLGEYCSRYVIEGQDYEYIMENHNRSLSRKKSSLSVMYKFLYRNEQIDNNITDGFNPIKMPKPQPDAIKRLAIEEVNAMLKAVTSGEGLTQREKIYWEKTKYRDKAILVLFVTYGLRVSELQQLNVDSFNKVRGEFTIYRKRGKEVTMPINESARKVLDDYLMMERGQTDGDHAPLFLSLQNKRMGVRAIRELVKKYTSIGMGTSREKGYSPHKLRATAATSLIEYGFSIYDVQNLMDHDNVTTTQLYAAHKKNAKRDILKNYEVIDTAEDEIE